MFSIQVVKLATLVNTPGSPDPQREGPKLTRPTTVFL